MLAHGLRRLHCRYQQSKGRHPRAGPVFRHGSHRGLFARPIEEKQGQYNVTVRWVSSHSGAEGNEVADRYAKSAATGEAPVEESQRGTTMRRYSPT